MSLFGFLFSVPTPPDVEMSSVQKPSTAEENTPIGVLWGTCDIKALNYTYFGDVKQVAIKTKQSKKG